MARDTFNRRRAARVLVEAQLTSDAKAAKAHHVSASSIAKWRTRLDDDPELAGLFAAGLERADGAWRDELALVVLDGARKLRELIAKAETIGDLRDVLDTVRTSAEILVEYRALVHEAPDAHHRTGRATAPNEGGARSNPTTLQ